MTRLALLLLIAWILLMAGFMLVAGCAYADIDLDRWADAILKAEGNPNYGILSIPCDPLTDECRRYCKNTVYNTLVKYRAVRCRAGEDDLSCLARRYAPIGALNDPKGLNVHWKSNVEYWLKKGEQNVYIKNKYRK